MASFDNLKQLGLHDAVALHSAAVTDFRSALQVLSDVRPDRAFNLVAQSSVGLSF